MIKLRLNKEYKHLEKNPIVAKWLRNCEKVINEACFDQPNLTTAIRRSQVEAGESAVMENLKRLGLDK